ncbi:hypothetical protein LTR36_000206 [Oleoguttula mirabilis]|uniref:Uncharacterized protein n=1 Tax=Oleoguttula mirabilis TaxID=1507867 RepID=A0AAV9JZY0_9PEZI|nr:hypothetical protein LTR36_000206 [Oleoguttula mirabilis]
MAEPPIKRKRGRPTKAQSQAKAAAEASAYSDPGPAPPTPLQISPQTTVAPGSAGPGAAEEAKPPLPPTARMPISAVLTPTAPKAVSSSSSSSGKRRRGRSMRSEAEGFGVNNMAGSALEYESPYGRAVPQDSPARAAVLRHREEPGSSQQPAGPEPTEPGSGSRIN